MTQAKNAVVWEQGRGHARSLMAGALGLQAAHVLLVCSGTHPVFLSNLLQLLVPAFAVVVCAHQRPPTKGTMGRRCWTLVGCAFLIWAIAQALFLYIEYAAHSIRWPFRPDDLLWVVFGLPFLLAIATTQQEADRVAWLDSAQILLFFTVVYLLIFLPGHQLPLSRAYLIQNIALVPCCILRLPSCSVTGERRFFTRLTCFLVAYSVAETLAMPLYRRGWPMGGITDLLWTIPISSFVVLTLWDSIRSARRQSRPSRLGAALNRFQGLSVAGLSLMSVSVAALLAIRYPLLGGLMAVGAFGLFAARANSRERLWHQAHRQLEDVVLRDTLTGLGNRIQLRNSLDDAIFLGRPERAALIFADLDRFKQINDSLGHAVGDCLLVEVGNRLRSACPSHSVVCRIGGDEFIILAKAETEESARLTGEQVLEAFQHPFFPGTHDLRCTASIGVVFAAHNETADELLRAADHAMYRAKQQGRDRVQVFDTALRKEMKSRWEMEGELRGCLERDEISVAFQPIYSIGDAEICGFEALARWHHPTLGNVLPSEFITLAEERGLIIPLGFQILEKACSQMAAWNAAWKTNYSVSVNVSPSQFLDPGLIPNLLSILDRTHLPSQLLRLEITETALLANAALVKGSLHQAREHGIRISLDDFGTGYSSLSFLLSLPVDEVKVDRSFVSQMHEDPDREEVVRTVIRLGHSLGKRVIAEGVETEEDLLGLFEMGCECAQGYLISEPLSPEQMEAALPAITRRPAPVTRQEALLSPREGTTAGSAHANSDSRRGVPAEATGAGLASYR